MIKRDEAPPSLVYPDDHAIIVWIDHDGEAHTWWKSTVSPRDVAYALASLVDSIISEFDLGESA